jgi:hypothetical protein
MHMAKLSMVTAQRLVDGRVVYLRDDRAWSQRDAEGWTSADEAAIEAALVFAKTQTELVVDPYRIEVEVDGGGAVTHTSARERIRAEGPAGVLGRFGPIPQLRAAAG